MNSTVPRLSVGRLILGVAVAVYLYAFMEPSAWIFYELHHLTGIGFIYYGYSLLRAAGYFFGQWEYRWLACMVVGLLVALPWWNYLKRKMRGAP